MHKDFPLPARGLVCLALLVLAPVGALISAQQAPQRGGGATQSTFTGTVTPLDASDLRALRYQYAAGARSYWHVHDGSQILLLEKGRGLAQIQGQPVQELLPGKAVVFPAGLPHWHGAAPDEGLTQIAVNVGTVKWMDPVTDQEYTRK